MRTVYAPLPWLKINLTLRSRSCCKDFRVKRNLQLWAGLELLPITVMSSPIQLGMLEQAIPPPV